MPPDFYCHSCETDTVTVAKRMAEGVSHGAGCKVAEEDGITNDETIIAMELLIIQQESEDHASPYYPYSSRKWHTIVACGRSTLHRAWVTC